MKFNVLAVKLEICNDRENKLNEPLFAFFDDGMISTAITRTFKKEDLPSNQTSLALVELIYDSLKDLVGDKNASTMPFCQFLIEKVCDCFYDKAWFKKQAGCLLLDKLLQLFNLKFFLWNQSKIIVSLQYAFIDLTGEVSNGVLELLRATVKNVLQFCAYRKDDDDVDENQKLLLKSSQGKVVGDLSREIASPNGTLREQVH